MNNQSDISNSQVVQIAEKSNIVLVDDVSANLRLLVGILARPDYMIRPILDPLMAISAIKADPPDIILLDIMMPTMSGYDVCACLKADPDTADIPIIFITAKDDVEDKIKGFSLGAVDYITKPFQAADVTARVQIHLKMYSLQKNLRKQAEDMEVLNQELAKVIVERQKAESLLRESYIWLHNVFDALKESVIILTPDRFIIDVNPAAEKIFGYSKDELKGRASEIFHVDYDHHLEFQKKIDESFNSGNTVLFEYRLKRKDGTIFPSEHSVAFLKTDGHKLIGIVSVVRDLTEKKEAEDKLIESEKLKAILEITGTVCHELNQPLMNISGYSELALMDSSPRSPVYMKLKKIQQQIERMAIITKKLMQISRYKTKYYPDGKIIDLAESSDLN
ncbi:MAG: response regulator [Desulfamplus sp.]|nr:response regulator [Desulfamplus sp.]